MAFKPMLAVAAGTLNPPYMVSPKLDGIRCLILNKIPLSRTLKSIPNDNIREILSSLDLKGLDGELICGNPTSPNAFRDSASLVMSKDKIGDWTYWVFDDFTRPNDAFHVRLMSVEHRIKLLNHPNVKFLDHRYALSTTAVDIEEEKALANGFEGLMLRSVEGTYKNGRTTIRENNLLKLKRFKDGEAVVIGFEEMMHNENEKIDGTRPTNKEGMVSSGVLGSLIVKDMITGVIFNIGSGFTFEDRYKIWNFKDATKGLIAKYKYFEIGDYDKPRFPVFLGFRDTIDI